MALKVGDNVRSAAGTEGEIVILNDDGTTAMVLLPYDGRGAEIVMLPLAELHQAGD